MRKKYIFKSFIMACIYVVFLHFNQIVSLTELKDYRWPINFIIFGLLGVLLSSNKSKLFNQKLLYYILFSVILFFITYVFRFDFILWRYINPNCPYIETGESLYIFLNTVVYILSSISALIVGLTITCFRSNWE